MWDRIKSHFKTLEPEETIARGLITLIYGYCFYLIVSWLVEN
jgi:hypothetical protein